MRLDTPALLIGVAGALVAVVATTAGGSSSVDEQWSQALRSKSWVTAFTDASETDVVPVRVDRVMVRAGASIKQVYQARADDVEVSEPVVSRDGTRLAFVKNEHVNGILHSRLYVAGVDGSDLRPLVELKPPGLVIKGAHIAPAYAAWSHDNLSLVLFGSLRGDPLKEPPALGQVPPQSLMRVDVATGAITRLRETGRRVSGQNVWGSVITSQAWAPDNRRIVYMDDAGHVRILDTVSREEQDLGVGTEPTWSPDGRLIGIKLPWEHGTDAARRTEGDYLLIQADRPSERTVLLKNPRSFWRSFWLPRFYSVGYHGAPIWSPDGRFVVVWRRDGEVERPHVLDRATGKVGNALQGFWGRSWGGRP